MVKAIRLSVLLLVGALAFPRIASADLTNFELRKTIRAADYWLTTEFPLAAAMDCDAQRHGSTGTWDTDSRCNVELERIAALVSLMTGGAFVFADAVTAWCSAAQIVDSAKAALASFREGPDMSQEARNQRAWDALAPYQRTLFLLLNTTLGFLMPNVEFE